MTAPTSQSAPPPAADRPEAGTSLSPTARLVWSRTWGILLAVALLVVTGIVIAALRSGEQYGLLDPRSAGVQGTKATAELLTSRGVELDLATTTEEAAAAVGPDTTLLIARPELLTPRQLNRLRAAYSGSGGRTVVLAPGPEQAGALLPEIRVAERSAVAKQEPRCTADFALRAGSVDLGGYSYAVSADPVDACYPHNGLPTLVRVPEENDTGDTVVLGAPDLLHNARLDEQGNASLALQLLGSRDHLVWYLPSLADPATEGGGQESLFELLPAGWRWGAVQLALAVVLLALWRARRLGPLVQEALPVTVHASEATEGRARLYRQTGARDRAAEVLRTATRARLAPLVGVPTRDAHLPEVLSAAVAARSTADVPEVTAVLFGPPPSDDRALVRLADDLDALERRITLSHTDKEPRS